MLSLSESLLRAWLSVIAAVVLATDADHNAAMSHIYPYSEGAAVYQLGADLLNFAPFKIMR
ncbi:hypothetical protein NBRC116493_24630 [Aurantivibrio infirmus]